jgi:Fur family ferric uptake transcriptional regulator
VSLPAVEVSQSPEDKFREYLASRAKPQRYTEQQRQMVRFIFSRHEHFDADQLIDDMRKANFKVSRATVYRTLNKLVDAGLLRRLEMGTRTYYEQDYGYPQHDHMHCRECKAKLEFQSPAIEEAIREICRQHQFNASGHTLLIQGICGNCTRARITKRRLDLI